MRLVPLFALNAGLLVAAVAFCGETRDKKDWPRPIHTKVERWVFPVLIDPDEAAKTCILKLYISADRGKTWKQVDRMPCPADGKGYFPCWTAPRDGEYWISLQSVSNDGKKVPKDIRKHPPGLIVILERKKKA